MTAAEILDGIAKLRVLVVGDVCLDRWCRYDPALAEDIDEAAQMSLADVLAVSQAAKSIVLLGDPRQLEQPIQGSHPAGRLLGAPFVLHQLQFEPVVIATQLVRHGGRI